MSRLRELDARLVPEAAARAQRWARQLDEWLRGLQERVIAPAQRARRLGSQLPLRRVSRLARLDERYLSRRPLAWYAAQPSLAFLVIGAIIAGGVTEAGTRKPDFAPVAQPPESGLDGGADSGSARVGPQLGANVAAYLDARRRELNARAVQGPDQRAYAVVSFTRYVTPAEAKQLVGPVDVLRSFFRVRLPELQTEVGQTPVVKDLVTDTLAAYRVNADARSRIAQQFKVLAERYTNGNSAEQKRFKDFYATLARASEEEAKALRAGCACVFSVVVEAPLRRLQVLEASPRVRLVDVAPPRVALTLLGFRGLLPEEIITVDNGKKRAVIGIRKTGR